MTAAAPLAGTIGHAGSTADPAELLHRRYRQDRRPEIGVLTETIALQLESEHRDSNTNVRVLVTRAQDQLVQNVRPALLMLLGAGSYSLDRKFGLDRPAVEAQRPATAGA